MRGTVAAQNHDLGALGQQTLREMAADEAVGAGDERDLSPAAHRGAPTAVARAASHGGVPECAQPVQFERVLEGVHAVPEAVVLVGMELAGGREVLERALLKNVVCADEVERRRLPET